MAAPSGHRNPDWTEDEVVLALDLYFDANERALDDNDPRVIELSDLLRSFPYHAEAARRPSFRNPAGVALKLQNLRQIATGKGMPNSSKTDRGTWESFGSDKSRTRARARLIRAAITMDSAHGVLVLDDEVFAEGRSATYAHTRRERNPNVRRKLIAAREKRGAAACDVCAHTPDPTLPYAQAVLEAHHLVPLSESGETTTRLSDMALLCANCHRMIHRAIAGQKRWLTLEEARHSLLSR